MVGVDFYFRNDVKPAKRIKLIKNAGFDTIITNLKPNRIKANGSIKKQVKLFHKYGLKLSTLHASYDTEKLPTFWKEGAEGDKILAQLISELELAKEYGFSVLVIHIIGVYSDIGASRLMKLLARAEEIDMPVAVENVGNDIIISTVLENIDHKYLGLCYDSGHINCFSPDFDVLGKFGRRLMAVHLHDNMGKEDSHTLNLFGNIDWDNVAKKLAKCPEVPLDYELKMYDTHGLTPEEAMNICFKQGKDLEFKIQTYRRENLKKIKIGVRKN